MIKKIKELVRVLKMKKLEKLAEIKKYHIQEQIKKLYQLIRIIEKTYCRNRMAKKQFRRDVVDRGFIHSTLMSRMLNDRGALDEVLRMNPEKEARKAYRLIKKLERKNKINKTTAKELKG